MYRIIPKTNLIVEINKENYSFPKHILRNNLIISFVKPGAACVIVLAIPGIMIQQ